MNDLEKAIELIRNHPVMDKSKVSENDKESVIALLNANSLTDQAQDIEAMELTDFEDFLVNNCGDD